MRRPYSRDGEDRECTMLRMGSGVEQVALQQSPLGKHCTVLKRPSVPFLDVNVPYILGCLNTWSPADGAVLEGGRTFGT